MASIPLDLVIKTAGNTVTVIWSGDDAHTGYIVSYHHPINETVINTTNNFHTFTEEDASQRVYTVGVQALSKHLPSPLVGPITARGQWVCSLYMYYNNVYA